MGLFDKFNPRNVMGKIIEQSEEVLRDFTSSNNNQQMDVREQSPLATPAPPPVPSNIPAPLSVMVAINGQQYGPYERATLIDMINNGSLTRETYVFIQGMSSWLPAGNVPEVSSLFGSDAIPTPPMPFAPGAPDAHQNSKSANGMSDRLNSLIDSAVADGEITDLERQVLIRNAQAEGVSMDEFVMVLEARLFEQRKKLEAEQKKAQSMAAPMAAPAAPMGAPRDNNTVKMGSLRKCPACNAVINKADATVCPQCGYEFAGAALSAVEAESPIQQLVDKLDAIDAEMNSLNPMKLAFQQANFYQRKSNTISTFLVPNNKKSLSNFLQLACSSYSAANSFDPTKKAWKSKSEEVMKRIKANYSDDEDLMSAMESTAKTMGIKVKKL
ncbi:MAG: GYF domain-containing protein [Muribaculaceae bacterium]|nr:GYF domain-containing protein [Muribaculaceae bacterium]